MKRVYFIGIGGTAMGNVAIALKEMGYDVFGSDTAVYDPMLSHLQKAGIRWFQGFSQSNIEEFGSDIIVVGNAVSRGNPEVEWVLSNKCRQYSLAELISELVIGQKQSFVVTGTHGKTTTSSMLAWILESAGCQPDFMIGAVPSNFDSGCRVSEDAGMVVLEGDEYDSAYFDKRSKFIHYKPDIACINHIEFDHADIFRDLQDVKRTFQHFIKLIPQDGYLVYNGDVETVRELASVDWCTCIRVGTEQNNDVRIIDMQIRDGSQQITFSFEGQEYSFTLHMIGEHNARNAVMACCMAFVAGVDKQQVLDAMSTFLPPKRRMEVLAQSDSMVLIDDFAHHPTAITGTLAALRKRYPSSQLVALFEPRSNTSTRSVMQREFMGSLSLADSVMIGSVHRPERYTDEDRMNVPAIVEQLTAKGITCTQLQSDDASRVESQVYDFLAQHKSAHTVIVTLSNGNVYGLRPALAKFVQNTARS